MNNHLNSLYHTIKLITIPHHNISHHTIPYHTIPLPTILLAAHHLRPGTDNKQTPQQPLPHHSTTQHTTPHHTFAHSLKYTSLSHSLLHSHYPTTLYQLRTIPREPTVIEFNKYVVELRRIDLPAARTLSKFCTKISQFVRARTLASRKAQALAVIQRVYSEFMKDKRKLRYRGVINIRLRAAKKIARW